jgi:hypothetical protein
VQAAARAGRLPAVGRAPDAARADGSGAAAPCGEPGPAQSAAAEFGAGAPAGIAGQLGDGPAPATVGTADRVAAARAAISRRAADPSAR